MDDVSGKLSETVDCSRISIGVPFASSHSLSSAEHLEKYNIQDKTMLTNRSSLDSNNISFPSQEPSLLDELRAGLESKALLKIRPKRNLSVDFSLTSSPGSSNTTLNTNEVPKHKKLNLFSRFRKKEVNPNFTLGNDSSSSIESNHASDTSMNFSRIVKSKDVDVRLTSTRALKKITGKNTTKKVNVDFTLSDTLRCDSDTTNDSIVQPEKPKNILKKSRNAKRISVPFCLQSSTVSDDTSLVRDSHQLPHSQPSDVTNSSDEEDQLEEDVSGPRPSSTNALEKITGINTTKEVDVDFTLSDSIRCDSDATNDSIAQPEKLKNILKRSRNDKRISVPFYLQSSTVSDDTSHDQDSPPPPSQPSDEDKVDEIRGQSDISIPNFPVDDDETSGSVSLNVDHSVCLSPADDVAVVIEPAVTDHTKSLIKPSPQVCSSIDKSPETRVNALELTNGGASTSKSHSSVQNVEDVDVDLTFGDSTVQSGKFVNILKRSRSDYKRISIQFPHQSSNGTSNITEEIDVANSSDKEDQLEEAVKGPRPSSNRSLEKITEINTIQKYGVELDATNDSIVQPEKLENILKRSRKDKKISVPSCLQSSTVSDDTSHVLDSSPPAPHFQPSDENKVDEVRRQADISSPNFPVDDGGTGGSVSLNVDNSVCFSPANDDPVEIEPAGFDHNKPLIKPSQQVCTSIDKSPETHVHELEVSNGGAAMNKLHSSVQNVKDVDVDTTIGDSQLTTDSVAINDSTLQSGKVVNILKRSRSEYKRISIQFPPQSSDGTSNITQEVDVTNSLVEEDQLEEDVSLPRPSSTRALKKITGMNTTKKVDVDFTLSDTPRCDSVAIDDSIAQPGKLKNILKRSRNDKKISVPFCLQSSTVSDDTSLVRDSSPPPVHSQPSDEDKVDEIRRQTRISIPNFPLDDDGTLSLNVDHSVCLSPANDNPVVIEPAVFVHDKSLIEPPPDVCTSTDNSPESHVNALEVSNGGASASKSHSSVRNVKDVDVDTTIGDSQLTTDSVAINDSTLQSGKVVNILKRSRSEYKRISIQFPSQSSNGTSNSTEEVGFTNSPDKEDQLEEDVSGPRASSTRALKKITGMNTTKKVSVDFTLSDTQQCDSVATSDSILQPEKLKNILKRSRNDKRISVPFCLQSSTVSDDTSHDQDSSPPAAHSKPSDEDKVDKIRRQTDISIGNFPVDDDGSGGSVSLNVEHSVCFSPASDVPVAIEPAVIDHNKSLIKTSPLPTSAPQGYSSIDKSPETHVNALEVSNGGASTSKSQSSVQDFIDVDVDITFGDSQLTTDSVAINDSTIQSGKVVNILKRSSSECKRISIQCPSQSSNVTSNITEDVGVTNSLDKEDQLEEDVSSPRPSSTRAFKKITEINPTKTINVDFTLSDTPRCDSVTTDASIVQPEKLENILKRSRNDKKISVPFCLQSSTVSDGTSHVRDSPPPAAHSQPSDEDKVDKIRKESDISIPNLVVDDGGTGGSVSLNVDHSVCLSPANDVPVVIESEIFDHNKSLIKPPPLPTSALQVCTSIDKSPETHVNELELSNGGGSASTSHSSVQNVIESLCHDKLDTTKAFDGKSGPSVKGFKRKRSSDVAALDDSFEPESDINSTPQKKKVVVNLSQHSQPDHGVSSTPTSASVDGAICTEPVETVEIVLPKMDDASKNNVHEHLTVLPDNGSKTFSMDGNPSHETNKTDEELNLVVTLGDFGSRHESSVDNVTGTKLCNEFPNVSKSRKDEQPKYQEDTDPIPIVVRNVVSPQIAQEHNYDRVVSKATDDMLAPALPSATSQTQPPIPEVVQDKVLDPQKSNTSPPGIESNNIPPPPTVCPVPCNEDPKNAAGYDNDNPQEIDLKKQETVSCPPPPKSILVDTVNRQTPVGKNRKSKRKSISFKPAVENVYHSPPDEHRNASASTSRLEDDKYEEFSRIQMTSELSEIQASMRVVTRSKKHYSSTPLPKSKKRRTPSENTDLSVRREAKPDEEIFAQAVPVPASDLIIDEFLVPPPPLFGNKPRGLRSNSPLSPVGPALSSPDKKKENQATVGDSSSSEKPSVNLSFENSLTISPIPKGKAGPKMGNLFYSTPLPHGKKSKSKKKSSGGHHPSELKEDCNPNNNYSINTKRNLRSRSKQDLTLKSTSSLESSEKSERSSRSKSGSGKQSSGSQSESSSPTGRSQDISAQPTTNESSSVESSPSRISIKDNTVVSSQATSRSRVRNFTSSRSGRSSTTRRSSLESYDSHHRLPSRRLLFENEEKELDDFSNQNPAESSVDAKTPNSLAVESSTIKTMDMLDGDNNDYGVVSIPSPKVPSSSQDNSIRSNGGTSVASCIIPHESLRSQIDSLRRSSRSSSASSDGSEVSFSKRHRLLRQNNEQNAKIASEVRNPKSKFSVRRGKSNSENMIIFPRVSRAKKRRAIKSGGEENLLDWAQKPRKLFKPGKWASKKLYSLLELKLKDKYGLKNTLMAEKIVIELQHAYLLVTQGHLDSALDNVRKFVLESDLCSTELEFWSFIHKFMPLDFRKSVIPMGGAFGSKIHSRILAFDDL